ncbi:anthranilate/aminodeoxychorismate synthase component II [Saccharobesus litoralis]|uniref:Anthranilate/aminodeoxychorismate synthase component II n=1 Tax=Saccharobesus litoralis TaxID=2172099 RepID=A0A2S0VMR9_9ALTE|nr:aminodeoxychorismate/anthranilate synthase component II [Saccharobesus litoralis]AWB65521.1 anthranilate/aminodeoxychorismate synthase component II [Saccharobesus litoralis]
MLLLIDNYDSFTFNLAHYFQSLDVEVKVVRNDEWDLATIKRAKAKHIVISPGPCTPNESGVSLDVITELAGDIPILGVCLGHQSIAQVYGAEIVRAPVIMHGKNSVVSHSGHAMFKCIPSNFSVTRYHSLMIQPNTLSRDFTVTATTQDNDQQTIMAIAHQSLPLWGVQYHPESVTSEYGYQLLENFLSL